MKKIFSILIFALVFTDLSHACFDTYLFVRRGSMVYPQRTAVLEVLGEYSLNSIKNPGEDAFFSTASLFYGFSDRFSAQVSIGSSERERGDVRLDSYGLRGVYNAYSSTGTTYTLDIISEYHSQFNGSEAEVELSFPNIFHMHDMVYVIHPTMNYAFDAKEQAIGGHMGIFHNVDDKSIVGVGAEYASTFRSSFSQSRLTNSEFSASLFFGTHLGSRIYVQNELAKGLHNSRDFGFALTTKIIL